MSFGRRLANYLGRLFGVDIVTSRYASYWFEERYFSQYLTALQVDCVFDVGANVGQFGRLVRKCGFAGTILSFEPAPKAFAALAEAAKNDPHWHVFNIALGSADTKLPFNVMESDDFSSFKAPTTSEDGTFVKHNVVQSVIEVPVERLDGFLKNIKAQHDFSRPFLKMDTQGYDLEVIRGAGADVRNFVGLSSELAVRRIYEDSPDMAESISLINELGFDFVNFFPVNPNLTINPVELNSYAVRRDLTA
ncbi:FkbM family methyltransferase [Sphingomonas sp. SRS2]|uniref:FkbM family methyltransferase n=1 Tax=Sphingomonas sp. SRS2 TaxID=133190 RepID=UPI000698B553|nr:FkbM family methyltransferase [Sphingomonas sp. SRS2]